MIPAAMFTTVLALCLAPLRPAAPPPELAEVTKALDAAGSSYRIIGPESDTIAISIKPFQYRNLDGEALIRILVRIEHELDRPWVVAYAYNLFSLSNCEFPDAARRALMTGWTDQLSRPTYHYDDSDGTITAKAAIPIPTEGLDPVILNGLLTGMAEGIDRLDPVLRRAMATGAVDWPADVGGPMVPTDWLTVTAEDGTTTEVGWAAWPDRKAWASTLIAAGDLLKAFVGWNDEQRDAFGRILASEFRGRDGHRIFADWVRGSRCLKRHCPPVKVRIFAPPGTKVALAVRCPDLATAAASETCTVHGLGYVDASPVLAWNDVALRRLAAPTKVPFEITITSGNARTESTVTVLVHPIGSTELGLPAALPTAIYVNESHPWVRDFVAEAGRLRVAEQLGCTKDTDFASAVRQVYAVWRAFRARDLSYVSIHEADGGGSGTQAIREFHDCIRDQAANCADGAAAVASVLRAIGFDVHLIRFPGHVLVGVYVPVSAGGRNWIFLETTAFGTDAVAPGQRHFAEYADAIPERFRDAEWDCFQAACEQAEDQVDAARGEGDAAITCIDTLRRHGVRCIPTSRADVGAICPPPNPEPLAARRLQARTDAEAAHAKFVAWTRTLPNGEPVPYPDTGAIAHDVERVGLDSMAIGRLLRSVEGDGFTARSLRAIAVLRDAMAPMRSAAEDMFGGVGTGDGLILRLPAIGGRAEFEPIADGRLMMTVRDVGGNESIKMPIRTSDGRCFIDGEAIDRLHEGVSDDARNSVLALHDDAFHDAEGFRKIGKDLAARIRAGEITDRDAMYAEMDRLLRERFGRDRATAE
jgi:hypothetical protein